MVIPLPPQNGSTPGAMTCANEDGVKVYRLPAGIFEIDAQLLVPERTSLVGARAPNVVSDLGMTPDWSEQTLFLATRGATDYHMNYCLAQDMVSTRVGFVLSSYVSVYNLSFQGIDTIRPGDNGALCGGGAFETKGCAANDCRASNVNNGGSDGIGSVHVTIENVRINDFHYAEDRNRIGASIEGNYDCKGGCCFCKPNEVRSSQVGVWVPETRNPEGTHDLLLRNVVSRSTQADGINLHGYVNNTLVENTLVENTGDDVFVLWGAARVPENVVFRDCVAVNPGILRPNWYGNCAATYGLKSVVFERITCKAPTLAQPIPDPADGVTLRIDTSMFVVFTSFGGVYPANNSIRISSFVFQDLLGNPYAPRNGSMNQPIVGRMAWTHADADKGDVDAPFYFPSQAQQVNVYVTGAPIAF